VIPCVAVDGPEAMAAHVLLVGCGNMGGALAAGWLEAGAAGRIDIVEPRPDAIRPGLLDATSARVTAFTDPAALPPGLDPDVVVLAVKPQAMDAVLPAYRAFAGPGTVFLSIAAGKSLAYFAGQLGAEAAVVRSIPNTPAAIGRGATGLVAGAAVAPPQRDLCGRLMRAAGEAVWVEDEALIDAVTAVSGSGPAYVFLMIESLAKAGETAGLPADLAMRLARQTVIGAAALAEDSGEPAETLRRNVASPGGTTAAALQVLMAEDGLQALFDRAVAAAAARSRELAG
jgi:pyrroline-5-carboxylate reductase